jgi:hypothetical protein
MKLKIQVRFFGSVKDDAGTESLILELPEGSRISDLKEVLMKEKPSMDRKETDFLCS